MYIFTPNTLIKSSEINANFAQVTLLENPVYAFGYVASNTADGVKNIISICELRDYI